jgi:hypothetical protein
MIFPTVTPSGLERERALPFDFRLACRVFRIVMVLAVAQSLQAAVPQLFAPQQRRAANRAVLGAVLLYRGK